MDQNADRIARQLALETAMDLEGQARLSSRTRRAEERSYASGTVYGKQALQATLGLIGEEISQGLSRISNGIPGQDHRLIRDRIGETDPHLLALLTMKVCLDVLGRLGGKDNRMTYTNVVTAIGKAVQTELRLEYYKTADPKLFKAISDRFHKATGSRQKATVYKLQFNREGIEWKPWSPSIGARVGGWLLDCLQRATGWITTELTGTGYRSRILLVRFSAEFLSFKEQIMERAMELASCTWPMLCEPLPWSNEAPGGYLTAAERGFQMVRAYTKGATLPQGEIPIAMLNNLQRQKYRINPQVMEVAEYCFSNCISIGQFKREERKEPPSRPAEGASEETIKEYKKARRILEDTNAQLERDNWRTTEVMYVARKFLDVDYWYLVWSFDYRGRVYTLNTCLTPQGTDFDKSLFLFADEGPINEYYLAFQVATCFGLDKATLQDRVEWTRNNVELISHIAQNPLDAISEWRMAAEPWCYLSACFEYYACCIAKTKTTSGSMVSIDATCSGIQHLAAMTADAKSGFLCNLLPTKKPSDGYLAVAERAKKYLPDELHPWMTRKVSKRTCMTTPYGVSRHSARGYIREALKEAGHDLSAPGVLTQITDAIYSKAMPDVFPGPVRVMNWIQESAVRIMREGAQDLTWTTPSGFVVQQQAHKPVLQQIRSHLMGSGRLAPNIYKGPGAVDIDKHRSCTAPNLVHSCDAALLALSMCYWDKPFALIHDCAMGRSCDMEEMGKELRLHFAEMYKGDVLQDWARQVGAVIPDGLIVGDLDVEQVNESDYFFC